MKKFLCGLAIVLSVVGLTGCGNQMVFDTVYTYDRAIIEMPNGEIVDVKVSSWRDYEDGDQIQVVAEDGTIYLTHIENAVLISTPSATEQNG